MWVFYFFIPPHIYIYMYIKNVSTFSLHLFVECFCCGVALRSSLKNEGRFSYTKHTEIYMWLIHKSILFAQELMKTPASECTMGCIWIIYNFSETLKSLFPLRCLACRLFSNGKKRIKKKRPTHALLMILSNLWPWQAEEIIKATMWNDREQECVEKWEVAALTNVLCCLFVLFFF